MTIGEALKQIRKHEGLTQKEMTKGLITESFYSKIERGVHSVDAETLINILSANHIDVTYFFDMLHHQNSEGEPNFDLINRISFAQNKKDLNELNKITQEIKNGNVKVDFNIKFRLENAYAWVLHSDKMVSPTMKRKVKSLILGDNWNRPAYHYLSQAVVMLNIDEAFYLVKSAFSAYKKNNQKDTYTLQFVSLIVINFLNCCYHKNAPKEYSDYVIKYLRTLPIDPVIGFYSVLGTYYEAVFNHDQETIVSMAKILKRSGYLSTIEDTLDEETKNLLK